MNRTRRMAVSTAVAGAVVVGAGAAVGAAFAATSDAPTTSAGQAQGAEDLVVDDVGTAVHAGTLTAQLKALDGQATGLKGSLALTKAQIEAALLAQQRAAAQAFTRVTSHTSTSTAPAKRPKVHKTDSPRPAASPTPSPTHTTTGASSSGGGDDNGGDDGNGGSDD